MARILFTDTETTDRWLFGNPLNDPRQPHLVELGVILEDDDGSDRVSMNLIIYPNGWEISEEVSRVHDITHEAAVKLGVTLANACYVWRDLAMSADIIVAHNLDFDKRVITKALFDAEVDAFDWERVQQRCTMKAATNFVKAQKPNGRGYKWPNLTEAHTWATGEAFDGAHAALADVRACRTVYHRLLREGAFNA